MLSHPWLSMPDNYNYKMTEMEQKLHDLKSQKTLIDNHEPDMNFLLNQKANLMNANTQHHVQMDLDELERMIAKKTAQSGGLNYRFPGQLAESDEESNAGDLSNMMSDDYSSDMADSDDSWAKSDSSNFSFSSEKMIDGYQDFKKFQRKMLAKKAEEEAEAAKHGGFGKKKSKKPRRKSKKVKKAKF
jgi:hypothetical protein